MRADKSVETAKYCGRLIIVAGDEGGEPRQGAVPAHPDGAGAVLRPVLVVGDGVTQHELGVVAGGGQLERDEAGLRIAELPGQL